MKKSTRNNVVIVLLAIAGHLLFGGAAFASELKAEKGKANSNILDASPKESLFLIYTMNTKGYMESCGCAGGGQAGGLARRATLIKSLKKKHPEAIILDGGNLSSELEKTLAILEAMGLTGYKAMGLGPLELRFCAKLLNKAKRRDIQLFALNADCLKVGNSPHDKTMELDAQAKNAQTLSSNPVQHNIPPTFSFRLKGKEIVVTSLVGQIGGAAVDAHSRRLLAQNEPAFTRTLEMDHLVELKGKRDLLIVISHLGSERDQRLVHRANEALGKNGTKGPLVNLIISASNARVPGSVKKIGRTIVLPEGPLARDVTLITVSFTKGANPEFQFERFPVSEALAQDKQVANVVGQYFVKKQREFLEESAAKAKGMLELGFASAGECGKCHEKEFESWANQKHAKAVQALREAGEQGRLVPECLKCHSEFFRRTGYFVDLQKRPVGVRSAHANAPFKKENSSPQISEGLECATCHGDGIVHSFTRDKRFIVRTIQESLCRACHTTERSPKFDYEEYLAKVKH